MSIYKLIITDLTRYGTLFCVAGWDVERNRMIRPEPSTATATGEASRFWDTQYVGTGKLFEVGNLVRLDLDDPPDNFSFPHATEDRIAGDAKLFEKLDVDKLAEVPSDTFASALKSAFEGNLSRTSTGTSYVHAGTKTGSLDAIEIDPHQIHFYETGDGGKHRLRASIIEDNKRYDFSVPADAARTLGANKLNEQVKASSKIHVRLGLSRPMNDIPDSCFAQINGVYFF
ncbi:dual OB domain-containing protein [Rhizobium sp. 21-4511-3d]